MAAWKRQHAGTVDSRRLGKTTILIKIMAARNGSGEQEVIKHRKIQGYLQNKVFIESNWINFKSTYTWYIFPFMSNILQKEYYVFHCTKGIYKHLISPNHTFITQSNPDTVGKFQHRLK